MAKAKRGARRKRSPLTGRVVFLSVYPSRGPDYGGEWDTDPKGARDAIRTWERPEEFPKPVIVKARILGPISG